MFCFLLVPPPALGVVLISTLLGSASADALDHRRRSFDSTVRDPERHQSNVAGTSGSAGLRIVTMVNPAERPRLFSLFQRLNNEICKRIQTRCSFQFFPAARAAAMVESGEADGENFRIADFLKDGKNPHHLKVDATLYKTTFVAWGKLTSPPVQSWNDLMRVNKEVIYLFGSKVVPDRLSAVALGSVMATYSVQSGVKMLSVDRATYFITSDSQSVCDALEDAELLGKIVQRGELESLDTFMYLNDKHRDLVPRVRAAIEGMKKDGTHSSIIVEYQNNHSSCG